MLKSTLDLQFVNQLGDSLKSPPSLNGYSDLFLTEENQVFLLQRKTPKFVFRTGNPNTHECLQQPESRCESITGKTCSYCFYFFTIVLLLFKVDVLKQRQSILIAESERCKQMYQDALNVTRDVHATWMNVANKNNGFGSLRETLDLIDQFRERLAVLYSLFSLFSFSPFLTRVCMMRHNFSLSFLDNRLFLFQFIIGILFLTLKRWFHNFRFVLKK